MKNILKYLPLVILFVHLGCDKQSVNGDSLPSLSESGILDMDGELALINKRIPSFGGFYKDENGVLNVFIKDEQQKMSAQEKASVAAALNNEFQDFFEQARGTLKNTVVKEAKYTWKQLNDWKQLIRGYFTPETHGIVSLDIDDTDNKLSIEIENTGKKSAVEEELNRLKIDIKAVKVSIVAPQSISSGSGEGDVRAAPRMQQEDNCLERYPLVASFISIACPMADVPGGIYVGGLGISFLSKISGHKSECSLGFNVEWENSNNSSAPYKGFITNSHCGLVGTTNPIYEFYQTRNTVRFLSKYHVGREYIDPMSVGTLQGIMYNYTDASYDHTNPQTGRPSGNSWNCSYRQDTNVLCRFSDASLVAYDTDDYSKVQVGTIAKPLMQNYNVPNRMAPSSFREVKNVERLSGFKISAIIAWPMLTDVVWTVGASTGLSGARVVNVCIDRWIDSTNRGRGDIYDKWTLLCQMEAAGEYQTYHGDSGGPVFSRPNVRSEEEIKNLQPPDSEEGVILYGIHTASIKISTLSRRYFSPITAIIGRTAGSRSLCSHKRSEICTALGKPLEARFPVYRN